MQQNLDAAMISSLSAQGVTRALLEKEDQNSQVEKGKELQLQELCSLKLQLSF